MLPIKEDILIQFSITYSAKPLTAFASFFLPVICNTKKCTNKRKCQIRVPRMDVVQAATLRIRRLFKSRRSNCNSPLSIH